ncbi:hypothetical protein B0H13DRAFT_1886891 [Mycena leptocephala]|nr:hypothetical protein B0H13DRAFT_1886891 [Mycena leptocephala]
MSSTVLLGKKATDQLQLVLISPLMPTYQVYPVLSLKWLIRGILRLKLRAAQFSSASDPHNSMSNVCGIDEEDAKKNYSDTIWARFHRVFIEYEANRLALAFKESALPHISRNNSIRFNANGHTQYLLYLSPLFKAFSAGSTAHFVQFGGTIQPDSTVIVLGRSGGPIVVTTIPPNCIRGYRHKIYAPFFSQGGEDRPEVPSWCQVETDVSKVVNKTTLGLYSFCLFVDQVWTVQCTGNVCCKRPSKSDVPTKRQKVNMVKGMKRILTSIKGRRPDG